MWLLLLKEKKARVWYGEKVIVSIDFLLQHFYPLSDHLCICHHSFIHSHPVAFVAQNLYGSLKQITAAAHANI